MTEEQIETKKKKIKERLSLKKSVVFPKRIIVYIVILAMIFLMANPALIPFLPMNAKIWLSTTVNKLFGENFAKTDFTQFNFEIILQFAVMILVMLSLSGIANFLLDKIDAKNNRQQTLLTIGKSVVKYVLGLFAILWGLGIIGVNVSTLFAGVSVLALIVGFGAETLIADVVTGIFMIFENQYNVGDIIEFDGFRGVVSEIGIRTTSLKDAGNNIKIINNSSLKNIVNRSSSISVAIADVGISYNEKLEDVEKYIPEILEKTVAENPEIFKAMPKYVGVQELGDSAVTLRFSAEVDEKDIFAARRALNRRLKLEFDRLGISIPFPQMDVHLQN